MQQLPTHMQDAMGPAQNVCTCMTTKQQVPTVHQQNAYQCRMHGHEMQQLGVDAQLTVDTCGQHAHVHNGAGMDQCS